MNGPKGCRWEEGSKFRKKGEGSKSKTKARKTRKVQSDEGGRGRGEMLWGGGRFKIKKINMTLLLKFLKT